MDNRIDNLVADLNGSLDNVKARENQGIKEKYEYNYLAKNLEKIKKTSSSTMFNDETFFHMLISELRSEAQQTLDHNTALGAHRAAHKILKITKQYVITDR